MNIMQRIDQNALAGWEGLGRWLEKVEQIGEIKRIKAEVDPDLEMSTITYLAGKTVGGPALLFENIKDHPGAASLFNPFGSSLNRVAMSIREEPNKDAIGLVRMLSEKMKRNSAEADRRRRRRGQSEHRTRRQGRRHQVSGAENVAAGRRTLHRHRRFGHHQGSRERPRQPRHLPPDDSGPERRSAFTPRPARTPRSTASAGGRGASRRRSPRSTASIRCCFWSRRPRFPRTCRSTSSPAASTARRSRCSRATSPA